MEPGRALLYIACGVLLALPCSAKVISASVQEPDTQWKYLGKFCFDTEGGELNVQATLTNPADVPAGHGLDTQNIVFYHDMDTAWEAVYEAENSCEWKREKGHIPPEGANFASYTQDGGVTYSMKNFIPRWWYVVFVNCEGENLAAEDVTLTFTNNGGTYSHHFSYDEEGIFEALIVFLVFLIILGGIMGYTYFKNAQHVSRTLFWLLTVVSIEIFSYILKLIHWSTYAKDGVGLNGLRLFALFLDFIPQTIMFGLFIALAKGWQIVTVHPKGGYRPLIELLCLYTFSATACFWWAINAGDSAENVWLYQNPPGVILVFLRVLILIWFLWTLRRDTWSLDKDRSKQVFYMAFSIFGTLWFLIIPIIVIIAEAMPDYNRQKTVVIMELLCNVLAYYVFFGLFARNNFQLKDSRGGGGSEEMETMGMTGGSVLAMETDEVAI